MQISNEVNSAKDTISGEAIWQLLHDAEKVFVTSGKKILEYAPVEDKEDMLAKASGRTGNLRAPAVRIGNIFYIGFNEELYREQIG